jgi:hypothetical protein
MGIWETVTDAVGGERGGIRLSVEESRELRSRLHEAFETLDYPVGYALSVRAGLREAGIDRIEAGGFEMSRTELGTVVAGTDLPHRDPEAMVSATLSALAADGEVQLPDAGEESAVGETQVFEGDAAADDGGDTRVFERAPGDGGPGVTGTDEPGADGPNFCTSCGTDLHDHEVVAFCPQCGHELA